MGLMKKVAAVVVARKLLQDRKKIKAHVKETKSLSIDKQFYVSFPAKRDWRDLESGMNNQNFMVSILKARSFIRNFGGSNIKVMDSTEDTRIYFDMSRTAVEPMFNDLKKGHYKLTLGEVKLRKD